MFRDRREAGKKLADELVRRLDLGDGDDLLVLSIPRGGVVVGDEVARRLGCEHGVVVTKKVGHPDQKELAIGAMGPDGEVVWDKEAIKRYGISETELKIQAQNSKLKVKNYNLKFKTEKQSLSEKTVVIVDDGMATGLTMKAAVFYVRKRQRGEGGVVVAVPVASAEAVGDLEQEADQVVTLLEPRWFSAVGQFYREFPQVDDEEVLELLQV